MERNYVTVVSGLPRSGTSLMMQALEAGGMHVLTDGVRKSNQDNPKGYYEFEPVKKTKENPSWLENATGKAVKMVYRLLYDLVQDYEYRIIFMQRKIDEVMVSQKKMLDRSGQTGGKISDEQLAELFKKELDKVAQWTKEQHNFSMVSVNYKDMVQDPLTQCRRVNDFLGGDLDVNEMVEVVDPSLYRNRL